MQHSLEQLKPVGDVLSWTAVLTAWLGVISTGMTILATGAALIWTSLRIYEMATGNPAKTLFQRRT